MGHRLGRRVSFACVGAVLAVALGFGGFGMASAGAETPPEAEAEAEVELLPSLLLWRVAPGETLGGIAYEMGMTLTELIQLNPDIANPDLIFPGQGVRVVEYPNRPRPADRPTYTVVAGDTLSGIARRHGVALAALLELNPHPNPDLIHPGELLYIPA